MEKELEYRRFAKILSIISKFAFVFAVIIGVLVSIFFIGTLFVSEELIQTLVNSIDTLGFTAEQFSFSINKSDIVVSEIQTFLRMGLFLAVVGTGIYVYVTYAFRKLMSHLVTELPFTNRTVSNLRNLGIGIVVSSFTTLLSSGFLSFMMMRSETFQNVIGGSVQDMNTNIQIVNWQVLIAGLVVLLMSRIFAYGVALQEEVDQTV